LLCKIQLDLFAPAGLETYAVRTLNWLSLLNLLYSHKKINFHMDM
jgi:hypothetical protein